MHEKPTKLPEYKELKELLKDTNNLVWYMRYPDWVGSEKSIKLLKKEIKKFQKNKHEKKSEDELDNNDKLTIL